MGMEIRNRRKESEMNATTVAVDLAKSVFQLAVADASWKVIGGLGVMRYPGMSGSTRLASCASDSCQPR